jgi:hypothetical protein
MAGAGELAGAPAPDDRVLSLTPDGWAKATEPLHGAGVGPGLAFGIALAEATGHQVGLVPCAKGATSLEDWTRRGPDSLYDRMLGAVRRAGTAPAGLLWYQGEADARTSELASSYGTKLEAWISRLRDDLNAPALPILLVQLGRYAMPCDPEVAAGWGMIREAQRQLAGRVPGVRLTSAVDLGLTDIVHLNAMSAIRVGRRLGRLACRLAAPRIAGLEAMSLPRGLGAVRIRCAGVNGGWQPRDHMSGFGVCGEGGQPLGDGFVINAAADREDASAIVVTLNRPPDAKMQVTYGMGANPYCNVTDENDMPLCAFGPAAMA